jgi:hypothetical protein
MAKDDVIIMRIPSALKAQAKAVAEADGRSLSGYIQYLLEQNLGLVGRLAKDHHARQALESAKPKPD